MIYVICDGKMETTLIMEKKLEKIEAELNNLKSIVVTFIQEPKYKKIVKLRSLLKGIQVSENDIKEAKNSLFKTGAL
jgi:hypothetical protein